MKIWVAMMCQKAPQHNQTIGAAGADLIVERFDTDNLGGMYTESG